MEMVGTRLVYGALGGVLGFKWETIYPQLDRIARDKDHWMALLFDFEVIERVAIREMNAKH